MTGEYLENIGELDGGYEVLVNYFGDRDEEFLAFAMSGQFAEDFQSDGGLAAHSISWLNEKIDEIDEALHDGNSITASRPKVSRAEISDHDWMETAWVLRYELTDIFDQVDIALRDRMLAVSPSTKRMPLPKLAPPPLLREKKRNRHCKGGARDHINRRCR
jgi:hypothetical protein